MVVLPLGESTQQSTTKATSTARKVVAMTAKATTKAGRVTAAGAMRVTVTTAATVATMTPNGDEENKDSNSKNRDNAMMKLTTTT